MSLRQMILKTAFCGLFAATALVHAADKPLMHCFTFTAVDGASQADWDAFHKATDALPKKIPGVTKVWYGKLARPMSVYSPDDAAGQKFRGGAAKASGEFTRLQRQYGVCMEMKGQSAYDAYAKSPAHEEWNAAYSKVRVEGTTTFDIIGQ